MSDETTDILDDDVMVTLSLDDGTELDCEILTIFELEGQDYIVLEPQEQALDPDCEECEVFVYRYFEKGDDDYYLENIQNEEEYEKVSDYIDELFDEILFEEM
ncbi:MAG: DUF1292 domain-containing protein [Lachnospiraceae bacterium]